MRYFSALKSVDAARAGCARLGLDFDELFRAGDVARAAAQLRAAVASRRAGKSVPAPAGNPVHSAELARLTRDLATKKTALESARGETVTLRSQLKHAAAYYGTLCRGIATVLHVTPEAVVGLTKAPGQLQAALEKKIEARAVETLAKLGVPVSGPSHVRGRKVEP